MGHYHSTRIRRRRHTIEAEVLASPPSKESGRAQRDLTRVTCESCCLPGVQVIYAAWGLPRLCRVCARNIATYRCARLHPVFQMKFGFKCGVAAQRVFASTCPGGRVRVWCRVIAGACADRLPGGWGPAMRRQRTSVRGLGVCVHVSGCACGRARESVLCWCMHERGGVAAHMVSAVWRPWAESAKRCGVIEGQAVQPSNRDDPAGRGAPW